MGLIVCRITVDSGRDVYGCPCLIYRSPATNKNGLSTELRIILGLNRSGGLQGKTVKSQSKAEFMVPTYDETTAINNKSE